jgi:tripartite-type tricarboxylate transporter receptor subunit TctC
MHPRRSLIAKAGLLALSALFAPLVPAQSGPIKIVVGYPAGATSDALARVVGEAMARRLNQPVIVENKTGAGGQIANQMVKMAPADGHTLLLTPVATMSIFPHSYAGRLSYDPFKDFAPVAHLSNFQLGLGVGTAVPARTLAEYVAWVKANPEKNGFYGSAAPGSLPHFFGVMFAKTAGIKLQHVPYRGTAAAMQALAGGEIAALSTVAADLQSLVQANKATLLAVAGEKRSPQFPNVPTFREQGYDLVATPWYGLFAPAGTPSAAVQRLAQAAMEAVQDPAVAQRLADMGVEPTGYAPAKLAEIMKADYERWGPPIRESGFKPGE